MVASRNVGLFSQATCCVACEYATVSSPFRLSDSQDVAETMSRENRTRDVIRKSGRRQNKKCKPRIE